MSDFRPLCPPHDRKNIATWGLNWGKIVLFSKLKVSTCWKGAFGEELASDALGDGFVSKSLILILKALKTLIEAIKVLVYA